MARSIILNRAELMMRNEVLSWKVMALKYCVSQIVMWIVRLMLYANA